MVIDMKGKVFSVDKMPQTYSKVEAVDLFNANCMYLWKYNMVTEGQLVDMFGSDVLQWVDYIYNIQHQFKGEESYRVIHMDYDVNEGAAFRAVTLYGFLDVVAWYNAKVVQDYFSRTPGGVAAGEKWDAEMRKMAEETAANRAREEEVKRKRHEYYLRKKAAREASEG